MHKSVKNLAYFFLFLITSCIDPYVPDLKGYKSLLVVDGLITNEDKSYEIKLSRSYTQIDSVPEKVADAIVYLTESDGTRIDLLNAGNGIYKTDSTLFKGTIGRKYTLHILTTNGNEYISDECPMLPVAGIDTLYYEKSEEIQGTPGKSYVGLKIFLNTAEIAESIQYLRWTYEETWKVPIQYPPQYTYKLINDESFYFQSVPDPSSNCWKKEISTSILINIITSDLKNHLNGQEIQFITPLLSDKLSTEYSILVKQYSISEYAYQYWKMLKEVQENSGDIFGKQPYPNPGNIHNVKNAGEAVLGYFEVSGVTRRRIFITSNELLDLDLPPYENDCKYIRLSPDDWPPPPPTWDEIYHSWVDVQHYVFVRPEVNDLTVLPGVVMIDELKKLVFTTPDCAFCEMPGFTERPDFWINPE